MIFSYFLASVLAISALIQGRSVESNAMTYEELDLQFQDEQTVVDGVVSRGGDDRSANLKYVTAIQNSSIWAEVSLRSLTVSTVDPKTLQMMNAAPESLSDNDLAAVKCACQDGLKCVAVDHLLVLKSTEEGFTQPRHNGRATSARRAITKITRVLTKYTNEYHEESAYQYVEVTESDDSSKVRRSVSVILKDNAELCGLVDGGANDAHAKTATADSACSDSSVRHPKTTGTQTSSDNPKPPAFVNNGLVNYGTINNYNINNGNINSATINSNSPVNLVDAVDSGRDTLTEKVQPNQDQTPQTTPSYPMYQPNSTEDGGKSTDISVPISQPSTTKDNGKSTDVNVPIGQPNAKEDSDKSMEVGIPTTQPSVTVEGGISTDVSAPISEISVTVDRNADKGTHSMDDTTPGNNVAPTDVSVTPNTKKNNSDNNSALVDASTQTLNSKSDNNNIKNSRNNYVTLANGSGNTGKDNDNTGEDNSNCVDGSKCGSNLSSTSIASVGSTNDNTVKDGVAEDGILNNNNMELHEVNSGVRNKGVVNRSNAANGIINVGTLNNGPTNYGSANHAANFGTIAKMNSYDMQQYAMDIDKMYSAVLEHLAA